MKLMFAIVNNDDSHSVSSAITKSGFRATKLASSGGFLSAGNTTFMIACEDDKVDEIIEVIRTHSRKRKQQISSEMALGVDCSTAMPLEVSVGGATIFITGIDRFVRV